MKPSIRKTVATIAACWTVLAVDAQANLCSPDVCDTYAFNYSARPIRSGCGVFTVGGAAVVMKANETGLGYAQINTTTVSTGGGGTSDIIESSPSRFKYDWNLGYRIEGAYRFESRGWDLFADWTHIDTSASANFSKTITNAATNVFVTYWNEPIVPAAAEINEDLAITSGRGSGSWRLQNDLIHLELGKEYFISPQFTMRPHIGLEGGRVNQTLDSALIQGISATSGLSTVTGSYGQESHSTCNFTGLGLRTGLDTHWQIGNGFSFYGRGAIGALYGKFKIGYNETGDFVSGTPSDFDVLVPGTYSRSDDFCMWKFDANLAVGLQWVMLFNCNTVALTLRGGWEQQIYLNMNQFHSLVDLSAMPKAYPNFESPGGDLSLAGFVVGARVDF